MKKLLYFSGTWCYPCKQFSPIVEQVASEILEKVDVDQNPDLTLKYNIRSIPTIVLLVDGNEIKRKVGVISKQEVINFIN